MYSSSKLHENFIYDHEKHHNFIDFDLGLLFYILASVKGHQASVKGHQRSLHSNRPQVKGDHQLMLPSGEIIFRKKYFERF